MGYCEGFPTLTHLTGRICLDSTNAGRSQVPPTACGCCYHSPGPGITVQGLVVGIA